MNTASTVPVAAVDAPLSPHEAWRDAAHCRNCTALLTGPWCSQCGQKKAARLGTHSLRMEVWQKLRWFELGMVKGAWRLLRAPGVVAREYVMGTRQSHVHPLKLLLTALGLHLLLLTQTRYLTPEGVSPEMLQAYELIRSYSKWSFSLGIVAIFASAWLVLRKRWGDNAAEILTLALYVHFLNICLQACNQLPLLVWDGAELLRWHKQWAPYYMNLLQTTVVLAAFRQFFALRWRADWALLALAGAVYSASKWAVSQAYARGIVELVMWQVEHP